jgi:hypothetical protein
MSLLFFSPLERRGPLRSNGKRGRFPVTQFFQRKNNRVTHAVDVGEDIVVPGAQDTQAPGFQKCCAAGVVGNFVIFAVGGPVNLHHEAELMIDEVNDVGAKGNLAVEFETVQPACPQVIPQAALGFGHLAAQALGTGVGNGSWMGHGIKTAKGEDSVGRF